MPKVKPPEGGLHLALHGNDFIKCINEYINTWKTDVADDFKDWPIKKTSSDLKSEINLVKIWLAF